MRRCGETLLRGEPVISSLMTVGGIVTGNFRADTSPLRAYSEKTTTNPLGACRKLFCELGFSLVEGGA